MYKTKLRLWKILFPAWLYFIEENDDVNEKKRRVFNDEPNQMGQEPWTRRGPTI